MNKGFPHFLIDFSLDFLHHDEILYFLFFFVLSFLNRPIVQYFFEDRKYEIEENTQGRNSANIGVFAWLKRENGGTVVRVRGSEEVHVMGFRLILQIRAFV